MTKHPSITRAQLNEAIEAGIDRARVKGDALPGAAQLRLRAVGKTATWIGVGDYGGRSGCGCPMTRAGLADRETGELTPLAQRLGVGCAANAGFTTAFDKKVDGITLQQTFTGENTRVRVIG